MSIICNLQFYFEYPLASLFCTTITQALSLTKDYGGKATSQT